MNKTMNETMNETDGRRPLKVRGVRLFQRFARWLSQRSVTPNQISVTSVFFAMLTAGCLLIMPHAEGAAVWVLPVLGAVFIQCRLLCNLFDGMVAVEGGKSTPSGELFNDLPDRIADPLILVSAGYATTIVPWCEILGWTAGLGAVMTAYVRTLGASIGAPVDFRGPMAKQHRMAIMTGACLLTAVEPLFWQRGWTFLVALAVITLGCVITVVRRARAAYLALEARRDA
jgi:phosphatidylglycerophosphate synthase